MKKYIVIVGGVMSGVGKGVATASIARIIQEYGYKTTAIKIDPYLNYDAGTLRPTEHGEVWVTFDGGEIDQDLGHYERFLGINIPKRNNITSGQIYKTVIDRERRGEYLGQTVQFIPHIPEEIKRRIEEASEGYEVILIEVGGTVGDYENIPFLFAIKGIEREIGKENVLYILITYLPVPRHIGEMKTKPTQQAIKMLQEMGIIPDIILCRGPTPLDDVRRHKIELYANIKREYVISAPDVDTLYEIPFNFEREQLGRKILNKLQMAPRKLPDWNEWEHFVNNLKHPEAEIHIAMVGKYIEIGTFKLKDTYISINEALEHSGAHQKVKVNIDWLDADKLTVEELQNYDGVIIPGGFGIRGFEGKLRAVKYVREHGIPFLGLCWGMQIAVVEYARHVLGWQEANSTEVDQTTRYPVVDFIPKQRKLLHEKGYGGTMRLGAYAAYLKPGTLIYSLYKESGRIDHDMRLPLPMERLGKPLNLPYVVERHRHRYEINPTFIKDLEHAGIVFSGIHETMDGVSLMEFMELPDHPFFVATQAHPEFHSRFMEPSPVFMGFVRKALERRLHHTS